jgi:hypothetical protein
MANLNINGTAFTGTPSGGNASAWRPTGITNKEQKIGTTLVAANGTRNRVERSINKRVWEIRWDNTNNATMLTLKSIHELNTTFTFFDLTGASYTVQTEDEWTPEFSFTSAAGNDYWNVTLVLYQV